MPQITFNNDATFEEADTSLTLLQMALAHGVPHIHACGGHARCSTCRVMVQGGLEHCHARTQAESALATRKGFDPTIRLACQTRVAGPVRVRRLVLDDADMEVAATSEATGREAQIAILFSDVRDFTPFAENQEPYDVVHVMNRYFACMGEIVLNHSGVLGTYIGDGLMAMFGVKRADPLRACRDAVGAALAMLESLEGLNAYLERNFATRFRIGIGVHFGTVVVGRVGHPRKRHFTAVGDAVNVAARVESATKENGVSLLISEPVRSVLGTRVRTGIQVDCPLKGKTGTFRLYEAVGLGAGPENPACAR